MASIYKCCHGKTIRPGKGWIDKDGTQHPSNWHTSWSSADKAAAGITEIVQQSPPDSRLYTWSHNEDGTVNAKPKPLDDVPMVDKDGSPVLDHLGNHLISLGVKSVLKAEVDKQQGSILAQSDWCVIREADTGKAVPAAIKDWRDGIRASGDAMCSAIDAAADHDAIAALFVWHDVNGAKNGILYDWPEKPVG